MARMLRIGWAVAFLLVMAGTTLPVVAAPKDDPKTPDEAVERVRPLLEKARGTLPAKKDSREYRDNGAVVNEALDLLKGQSKEGFLQASYRALWNEAVSLGHYHAVRSLPDYRLEDRAMKAYAIRLGLPTGRGWEFREQRPQKNDQQWGEVTRTLGKDRVIRILRIWVYKWDTVYSGIGGENAKNLAEEVMAADREKMTKVTYRSDRIVTRPLSRGFPKTSYYEMIGEDEKLGPVRRRNYYVKGRTETFCFEAVEIRATRSEDDPWTRWQIEGEDPELEAVLASLAEGRN